MSNVRTISIRQNEFVEREIDSIALLIEKKEC